MPEATSRAHRWPAGILRTGRAVAFLTLASGINGTAAALLHNWDSRWVLVATVGIVAALDGWVIGIAAAVGAVISYQLMSFGTLSIAADRDALLLAVGIVVAIAARAMRVSVSRPQLETSKTPALLAGDALAAVDLSADEAAAGAVQQATASLRRALAEERARAERERLIRQEDAARSAAAVDTLKTEVLNAEQRTEELRRQHAAVQAAFQEMQLAARGAADSVADHERSEEQLRAIVREAEALRDASETRAAELEQSLRDVEKALADAQALRNVAAARNEELERVNGELRDALSELTTANKESIRRAEDEERQRTQLASRLEDTEVSREAALARAAEAERSRDQLLVKIGEIETSRRSAMEQRAQAERAAAELRDSSRGEQNARREAEERIAALESNIAQLHSEAAAIDTTWNEKLAQRALELTVQFQAPIVEANARAEAAERKALDNAARADELSRAVESARDQHREASAALADALRRRSDLETENAQIRAAAADSRESIDAEWRDKLQAHISEITQTYNQAAIEAEQRSDAALQQARALAARIEELERDRESLRAGSDRAAELQDQAHSLAARLTELQLENERLQTTTQRAESLEGQVQSLVARLQELEAANEQMQTIAQSAQEQHAEVLATRVAELESETEMLRRAADDQETRVRAEWSERFARSAMEITQRFQGELSAAAARERDLQAEGDRLINRVVELEHERAEIRDAFDSEKARLDAEWNEKLETIVAHLATDHEADLGQATLEREEARAEARRLAKKLSDIDGKVREVVGAYGDLQKENEQLRAGADQLLADAVKTRDAEWNARVAANALELTQRFNGAMALADSRLMEANEEAAHLASRVRELEGIIAGLRSSDDQRRAAIDAEWNEKLQTIVSHLAIDHEADIGQAMLEKEEARAEARMLSMRAGNVQKTLESERASFQSAKAAWSAEREQLLGTIEALKRRAPVTSGGTTRLPIASGGRPSIFVVHHDSAVRAIAKHALESSGYDVTTAADGLEAFRVALAQRPDVVLVEAQMPKMDGRELVQMLKSRPETSGVKIVLITEDTRDYASAGEFRPDDFLRDPANIEVLKLKLASVLGARV